MATPSLHDKGPGELDNSAICQKLSKSEERKRKPQSTYSHEYRYLIAKYAKERGYHNLLSFAIISIQQSMSSLGEHLSKNMTKTLNLQKTCRHHLKKKLKNLKRGRSLMVVSVIDEKVQKFMVLLYKKAGHISRSIAAATAIVLISRTDEKSVYNMFVTST